MGYSNHFYTAIGVVEPTRINLNALVKKVGIPLSRLRYYNLKNIVPSGGDLEKIMDKLEISELELMIKMGRLNRDVLERMRINSDEILKVISSDVKNLEKEVVKPVFTTPLGELFQGDCLDLLTCIESDSVDLVFADPPFNLDKLYPSKMNDNIKEEEYLKWSELWMSECIRVLKPGGSLFYWNLPIWNVAAAAYLNSRLTFRHWIAVDMKCSLPIKNKLYPSHYSLLYYIKGEKPNTYNADRLPTQTCPKCFDNLKDYGGYKHKMNPLGVSLTDVWSDISPVRHAKYKKRDGANELPLKLLDRVIQMASKEGDIVLDPFGGSGTTYAAAELKGRRWIGMELGPCEDIVNRFNDLEADSDHLHEIRSKLNALYPDGIKCEREKRGLWTCESLESR